MAVARKQQQVGTEALPGVRRTAAETAISQGAGVSQARARTFETIADVGQAVATQGVRIYGREQAERRRVMEEERQRANDVAVLAGDNRLAGFMRTNVYDAQTGALTKQGPASFELPETLEQEFDKLAGEIERGLGNDEQRLAFAKIRSNRREAMSHTLHAHVARERQSYAASELKANTENTVDLVIANANNPELATRELAGAVSYIRRIGPTLGMGPEAVDADIAALNTRAVGGIIERLVDQGNIDAARVYYEELGGQISGDAKGRIEKALKAGDLKKRSQTKADEIIRAGGTVDDWREKAKAIENADERDAVIQLVEHEQQFIERRDREQDETRMRNAADVIDRTRSMSGIPVSDLSEMSPAQRSALRSYTKQVIDHNDVETEFGTLYGLFQMAGDDPEKFVKENLLNYVHKLSKQDREQVAQLQLAMKTADKKKADSVIDGFMTNQQIVSDALLQAGLDPSPKPGTPEVEPVTKLRREVDRRVQALQTNTGKKATNADVQEIVDELLLSVTTEKGTLLGAITSAPYHDVQKRLMDITIADIPVNDRAQIEDALRSMGTAVTDQAVLSLYRRHKFVESRNRR